MIPNFLVIGAARCGTTTLHHYLRSHPNIFVPRNKRPEPHFFMKSDEFSKGFEYYCNKYFIEASYAKAIGEISTSNLYQPWVAGRIKKYLPNIKLIICLRNPIERAYSNYLFTRQNKLENLSFEKAIYSESKRILETEEKWKEISPYAYLDRGLYFKQIQNYLKYFDKEQMFFIFFDDFIAQPKLVLKELFTFLEVNKDFLPKSLGIKLNSVEKRDISIPDDLRNYMKNYFKKSNNNLENLLSVNLSHWI